MSDTLSMQQQLLRSRTGLVSKSAEFRDSFASQIQKRGRKCRRDAFVVYVSASKKGSYIRTSPDRKLRTPHSGYHFDGSTRRFFEGWYFKVSLPEYKESFCFMYSVEDPAFAKQPEHLQELLIGRRFPGVGAQILGPEEKYICQYSETNQHFWGDKRDLLLGNTFSVQQGASPPMQETTPKEFLVRVKEGFQVTPTWHQGFISDDGRSTYVQRVSTARWEYSTKPIYGWGDVESKQKSTAGWLAAYPVFEPHWQICMAGGLSTGWIEWGNQIFEFENAPSYSEKNWGGSFPQKWFWVQCNVFYGATGEIALTAGGGKRNLGGLPNTIEDAAMIGIHYDGRLYEFVPWKGTLKCKISPWGFWHMKAQNDLHEVELLATTSSNGTVLRAPTYEAGLVPFCKDTCYGEIQLKIWKHPKDCQRGQVILDVTSDLAALEIGGGPWYTTWKFEASNPFLLRKLIGLPVDLEGFFNIAPMRKPPGL